MVAPLTITPPAPPLASLVIWSKCQRPMTFASLPLVVLGVQMPVGAGVVGCEISRMPAAPLPPLPPATLQPELPQPAPPPPPPVLAVAAVGWVVPVPSPAAPPHVAVEASVALPPPPPPATQPLTPT